MSLDLARLPDDGYVFQGLVQELLIELGYDATSFGPGQDRGIDLIATKIVKDVIGGPRAYKYIIQCKHFAGSGRSVSRGDLGDVPIPELVVREKADGYLVITSSSFLASLQKHLMDLGENNDKLSIDFWDHITLSRLLSQFPYLVAKYFPGKGLPIGNVARPTGKSKQGVYDRIKRHSRHYVGMKYIPELYVSRSVEESLYEDAVVTKDRIHRLENAIKVKCDKCAHFLGEHCEIPELLFVPHKYRNPLNRILKWRLSINKINDDLRRCARLLEGLTIDLWTPYCRGGVKALAESMKDFEDQTRVLRNDVEQELSQVFLVLRNLTSTKERADGSVPEEHDGRRRSGTSGRLSSSRVKRRLERPMSDILRDLRGYVIKANNADLAHSTEVGIAYASCRELRNVLLADLFEEEKKEVQRLCRNVCAIVDVAGSGKTNMLCRLALQLSQRQYCIFLTGRSFGEEFSSFEHYIKQSIVDDFPARGSYSFEENIKWLNSKDYALVLVVDGINEARDKRGLLSALAKICGVVNTLPARVLVSTRTEYWDLFRARLMERAAVYEFTGKLSRFSEREHRIAIPLYLKHFKIETTLEDRALQHLRRPLVLRFFCEAFASTTDEVRLLPPIRDIRLRDLFAQYTKIKYAAISEAVSGSDVAVQPAQVEDVLLGVARLCLLFKSSNVSRDDCLDKCDMKEGVRRKIFEALVDEDIIVEEYPEIKRSRQVQYKIGFVYEAFMEYLMALVIHKQAGKNDKELARILRGLYASEDEFENIRGVGAFILPLCKGKTSQSREIIFNRLRSPGTRDLFVATLLNVWGLPYRRYVEPILIIAYEKRPNVPLEELRVLISDMFKEQMSAASLKTIEDLPQLYLQLMGPDIAALLRNATWAPSDHRARIGLVLLRHVESDQTASSIIDEFFLSRQMSEWLAQKPNALRVFSSMDKYLEDEALKSFSRRHTGAMWSLGRLGRTAHISYPDAKRVLSDSARDNVIQVVKRHFALRSSSVGYGYSVDVRWWACVLDLDPKEIELDSELQDL